MSMMISSLPKTQGQPRVRIQSEDNPPPQKPNTLVDKIIDKTYLTANFTACTLSGGVAGLGAFARSATPSTLKAIGSFYPNLWKAETIGPNLKIIGSVAAAPLMLAAAIVGLPVSLVSGMYQGGDEVDSSKPRQFTIGSAVNEGYNKTRQGWESLSKGAVESFQQMGAEKLGEGEKPFDIPIIKTLKTAAVGVTAAAIGGIAGVVSALVSVVRQSAAGIGSSFGDESLNIGGKLLGSVGAVLGGVVHGAVYGATTALSVTGHGFAETWKKDSLLEGGQKVLNQAWNSLAASAAPQATLLQEKPQPPQA